MAKTQNDASPHYHSVCNEGERRDELTNNTAVRHRVHIPHALLELVPALLLSYMMLILSEIFMSKDGKEHLRFFSCIIVFAQNSASCTCTVTLKSESQ